MAVRGEGQDKARRSRALAELVGSEDAMEMVEWAIVGVVFAVACAVFWGDLTGSLDDGLGEVSRAFGEGGPSCGQPPCGQGGGKGPP